MQSPHRERTPIRVLLVEDSPGDVRLTLEAFRSVNPGIRFHVATDGVEAMAYLRREGDHKDAFRPDLILLDLKLPRMDGHEVLAEIKKDDSLKAIPTVVLTTSDREGDVSLSYEFQANCHLRKPAQWDDFDKIVRWINDFWLTKVQSSQGA